MLKDIIEIGKQIFGLAREIGQNKKEFKQLHDRLNQHDKDIEELQEELRRITEMLQRLAYEYQRQNDRSESERKMLLLEVENMILRYQRGLPPANKPENDATE